MIKDMMGRQVWNGEIGQIWWARPTGVERRDMIKDMMGQQVWNGEIGQI
jgi:hypothetical protein